MDAMLFALFWGTLNGKSVFFYNCECGHYLYGKSCTTITIGACQLLFFTITDCKSVRGARSHPSITGAEVFVSIILFNFLGPVIKL